MAVVQGLDHLQRDIELPPILPFKTQTIRVQATHLDVYYKTLRHKLEEFKDIIHDIIHDTYTLKSINIRLKT